MNDPEANDDELMLRSAAGDDAAFAEIVRRWRPRLERFASSVLRDQASARDLVQEVLAALHRRRRTYTASAPVSTYLFACVRNRCRDRLGRRFLATSPVDERVTDRAPTPDARAEREDMKAQALELIGLLEPGLRELVHLHLVERMSYSRIAEIVGDEPSTLRTRMQEALARLRSYITGE